MSIAPKDANARPQSPLNAEELRALPFDLTPSGVANLEWLFDWIERPEGPRP